MSGYFCKGREYPDVFILYWKRTDLGRFPFSIFQIITVAFVSGRVKTQKNSTLEKIYPT